MILFNAHGDGSFYTREVTDKSCANYQRACGWVTKPQKLYTQHHLASHSCGGRPVQDAGANRVRVCPGPAACHTDEPVSRVLAQWKGMGQILRLPPRGHQSHSGPGHLLNTLPPSAITLVTRFPSVNSGWCAVLNAFCSVSWLAATQSSNTSLCSLFAVEHFWGPVDSDARADTGIASGIWPISVGRAVLTQKGEELEPC